MSCTATDLKSEMSNFIGGSLGRYRHWANPRFIYTEGVHAVAEKAGAHWLLDILATEFAPVYAKAWQENQASIACIVLDVTKAGAGNKARLTLSLEDDAPLAGDKAIDFTDFPEGQWTFYFGTDEAPGGGYLTTMMIPEEY